MHRRWSRPFAVALALAASGCDHTGGSHTLTVLATGSGAGTITSSPAGIDCGATCTASFAAGATVTLAAAPAAGSTFSGWTGDCAGADPNTTIVMDASRACAAIFTTQLPDHATLTVTLAGTGTGRVTSSPSGIACGASCAANFAGGLGVTLTAAPDAGSTFSGWSGDCSGAGATTTVTMNAARSCTATFSLQIFALTVTRAGSGAGTVTSSPTGVDCGSSCAASFAAGTSVTLSAAPQVGSIFAGWSGDCSGAAPTATVTMSAARSCTATFTLQSFALTVAHAGNGAGTITSSPAGVDCSATCSAIFPAGAAVTLTAAASSGSTFSGWSGDCSGAAAAATVTMSAARSCTATFFAGAPHLPFPQMPSHGQSPLTRLQLVTITFAGDPDQSFVESFGDFVVGSQWLGAITQDYGPITATHLAKVNLPATSNPNYASLVLANIGGALPYPSDPTGLLYLFYAPSPCPGGGYHSVVGYNGQNVAYAVANNCNDGKSAEGVASHEIGEVLTDAYLGGLFFDGSNAPWVGEDGDICNSAPWWMEGGYRFEPIWSNSAAASGGSPCVPWMAGHPYFNVSPSPAAPQIVAPGGSVVITLTGWSTAPVAAWPLVVNTDGYATQSFNATPSLSLGTINDGTSVQLTLHVPPAATSGGSATLRVHSVLPDVVDGVGNFSADWSVQVIAQ